MSLHPELRNRLETAVRNNQQMTSSMQKAKNDASNAAKASLQPAKPTIELKMDFSNFNK